MTSAERLRRLIGRATFGARPEDLAAIATIEPEAWLPRELAAARDGSDPGLEERLRGFSALERDPTDVFGELPERTSRRPSGAQDGERQLLRAGMQRRQEARGVAREMAGVRVVRAVHGRAGLREVMIDFWANHFSVFGPKGFVGALLPHYEREVLERHALGRFEDLLIAVAKSPAMLVYLDNWTSTAPRGRTARFLRRRGRPGMGGINENYARELLELHTLGVDGGYTQSDVEEVARVFTGWSLASRRRPEFGFHARLHDSGTKRVLGERVRGGGQEEGEHLLRRLARHPSTARHLSRKLAARFVSDVPPPGLVDRAARIYLETEGDLAPWLESVLLAPELYAPEHRKLKTPLRFVASAIRATGGETDGGPAILQVLGRLGELPYFARTPAGYPEETAHWVDPGGVLERMGLAFAIARGQVRGTTLGAEMPPGAFSSGGDLARFERLAMTFATPEFQWT